ncbi:MAG: DUF255 domain-containing protein [candidate division Zixibacteria bacterium]|nr:DUF255 domain-containing protein [candidate division Zixibacteria bacterium]
MKLRIPQADELKKLPSDGGDQWNRLVFEKSPYLLQHAKNPVDWYPWGEEAFGKAKAEDKPIFLSIGYSTCHWCHVMERESFEDTAIADLMNKSFICIKVDREERPDIDNIYMTVCQMLTGSGGWPLTVILTPDLEPFFAGTYFPKYSAYGRNGMNELIPALARAWKESRSEIVESSGRIIEALDRNTGGVGREDLGDIVLTRTFDELKGRYDERYGGFGSAPKFPTPHNFLFLLRYWKGTGEKRALSMVENSLRKMRLGGIYDHIGYGFHRYSTDEKWLLPHFEKMLYDQALLTLAYLETYQATGDEFFAEVAREILEYVERDMTSKSGGFYSAEDADSEGVEGKFYVWKPEEIESVLGEEDGKLFMDLYRFEERGNFREQATGEKTGDNIPHLTDPISEIASIKKMDTSELENKVSQIRQKLFDHREKRIHPYKDDKILSDWNGLMIAAFSRAAAVLNDRHYADIAKRAVEFIMDKMMDDGRLWHRYREGEAGINGHLDDYSFMVRGLIELYQATFDAKYLKQGIELNDKMIELFWDFEKGGLYMASKEAGDLIVRPKEIYDGAIPSGNSIALLNLIQLSRFSGNSDYENKANELLKTFSGQIAVTPSAYAQMLTGLDYLLGESLEIVIVGETDSDGTSRMLSTLWRTYLPNTVIILRRTDQETPDITEIAPYTANQNAIDNKTTAYICRNFSCDKPITDVGEFMEIIKALQ